MKIIAAVGCFDLLHPGHVHLLEWARAQGDWLTVLVNDDAGVRAQKGEGRPILCLADRCRMLAGLACVDAVIPFAGIDPRPTLAALKPWAQVKGPEYAGKAIREADVCPVLIAPASPFTQHTSDLIRA